MTAFASSLFEWNPPPIAHARHRDPETSHEAAKNVKVTESQAAVLATFACFGAATDEQLHNRLVSMGHLISESGARTRRSELVALGRVRFTGKFAETATGRKTRIWELAEGEGGEKSKNDG